MIMKTKMTMAGVLCAGAIAFGGQAVAGEMNPKASTPHLQYGDVLRIKLPYGMCEFEQVVPAYVVDQLSERRDWRRLVEYMLANCPELGLPLADTVTASISGADADGDSGDGGSDSGSGGSSGGGGGGGGSTGGDSGSGSGSDDDGNNGHGNDADGHDESNPGKS